MRGAFIALMVMGSIWTGGLVWSIFGGLVLVPQSTIAVGGARTALAPPAVPVTAPSAARPSAGASSEVQAKPQVAPASGHDTKAAGGHGISHADQVVTSTKGNQPLEPKLVDGVKVFDVTASVVQWEVAPGEFVEAWAYNGTVPGPLLRVTEGDKIRVVLKNELPEPTVIHIHGPMLPNAMDGVPDVTQPVVNPGESFAYEIEAKPSGTFLYHTHHNSVMQKSRGLYGVLQIDPKDAPKTYDREYFQVVSEMGGFFVINGKAFPSTEAIEAKLGERVRIRLVNLGEMVHPMHSHGFATKIVGTDGHPVPEAAQLLKDTVTIGPGERYDLEFIADNPGTWVYHCHILSHVQNKGVEPGGMISVIKVTE
jgi:FtsP/CotA-like multicopper oxidase with cupredoxin domain